MGTERNFGTKVAVKLLGGIHFVGQTMADISINAEVKLLKPADNASAMAIVKYRTERSYNLACKLRLLPNPSEAIADMTQSEQ